MKRQYRSTMMKHPARNLAAVVVVSALTAITANAFAAVTATIGTHVVASPDRSANFSALPFVMVAGTTKAAEFSFSDGKDRQPIAPLVARMQCEVAGICSHIGSVLP